MVIHKTFKWKPSADAAVERGNYNFIATCCTNLTFENRADGTMSRPFFMQAGRKGRRCESQWILVSPPCPEDLANSLQQTGGGNKKEEGWY